MRAEYWVLAGLALVIAEVLAPGTFLIFFAAGALITAAATMIFASLTVQLGVFVAATILVLLIGNSFYRRLLVARKTNGLGTGPIGEPGVVEESITGGRGRVRVRDISWLAEGPDLPSGTPIVVVGRSTGTLLQVAPRASRHPAEQAGTPATDA